MITAFCQKIAETIQRPVKSASLSGSKLRYSAEFFPLYPFLDRLNRRDLSRFTKTATFSIRQTYQDTRSAVIQLDMPFEIEGRRVRSLRLKGIFAQAIKGIVKAYEEGDGFVDTLVKPVGEGKIIGVRERQATEYSAKGTMRFDELEAEVKAAIKLGPEITDILLGYGIFEKLSFNGQPVGFVVYGMERQSDDRCGFSEDSAKGQGYLRSEFGPIVEQMGNLLRGMHERQLFHGYPHEGNFGINHDDMKVRLVDLDTAVEWASLPPDARLAFLYLDLSKAISHFYESRGFLDEDHDIRTFSLIPLLPHLFWGYFKGDTTIKFVRRLRSFMGDDADSNYIGQTLINAFGLPYDVSRYPRCEILEMIKRSPFLGPRILAELEPGKEICLRSFLGAHQRYDQFFQAICSVAAGI